MRCDLQCVQQGGNINWREIADREQLNKDKESLDASHTAMK